MEGSECGVEDRCMKLGLRSDELVLGLVLYGLLQGGRIL
jgi:hypothetical protein